MSGEYIQADDSGGPTHTKEVVITVAGVLTALLGGGAIYGYKKWGERVAQHNAHIDAIAAAAKKPETIDSSLPEETPPESAVSD